MARKKVPPDLAKLADDAKAALDFLENEGYETEVLAIRDFITAQGEHFVETQKINRNILRDILRQSQRKPTETETPVAPI